MPNLTPILIGIAWLIACALALPLSVLAAQCLIALFPERALRRGERRRVSVLIPAHNEAGIIADTLGILRPQLREHDRLVVVADNCADATAEIARRAGAEVVERTDAANRGKGFALDAGVRFIQQDPTDVVIVVDADCVADGGLVDQLARAVDGTERPVQALYLMRPSPRSGPESMVSSFAFLVKNWVRARALQRVSIPVLLTGSGMAFPWQVIEQAALANAEIVEDLALGLKLTQQGNGPRFYERATVWSQLPTSASAAISQRTRWEHGYLNTILHYVPWLVMQACRGRPDLILVALDLAVPPLSLLVLLSALACVVVFLLAVQTGDWLPLEILLATGGFAVVGICVCWWRFARQIIPPRMLASVPAYVLGKIGIYRGFVGQRQTQWIRTQRDGEFGK